MTQAERDTLWAEAGCTGAELWAMQQAASGASWPDAALILAGDDARRIRAYGHVETRWLDQALRIGEKRVERDFFRGVERVARYQLGLDA
jgi:hypothetical protein